MLFRGNAEAKIRAELLKQGLIKGIIGLPANLFYGTGIPACIIVIDKEHAQTAQFANDEQTEVVSGGSVFMIDASKYFIKDGNKNRLRDQDIHKIIDTFTKRLEIAHYSRQVSLQEIVEQDYNLNLPRYIDSGEREDIQDLNAHLYGDIPVADIDDLAGYWQAFPQLKNELFEAKSERYHAKLPTEQIKSHILAHSEYAQFKQRTLQPFAQWQHANNLRQIAQGNRPKELIHQWSESLLDCYKNSQLVANYDIYQILMNYWQDMMQDDVYMICQDGWDLGKQLLREIKKPEKDEKGKTPKAEPHDFVINKTKYKAELIPPTLIAKRYFGERLAQIQSLQTNLDTASQELESYLEEHGNGLLENAVDNKDKITAKSLKLALKNSIDSEEQTAIKNAIKLFEAEKPAKDALKTATEALDRAVFTQYGKLSASDIQQLVVDDKWLADLGGYIHSEMERIVQTLASRVQTLETRYHESLSQIEMQVAELTAKVNAHLKAMGL